MESKFNYTDVINITIEDLPVIQIGSGAFDDKSLTSVVIPNSVKNIYDGSFTNNQITTVTIPSTVEAWGCEAFDNGVTITNLSGHVCTNDFSLENK